MKVTLRHCSDIAFIFASLAVGSFAVHSLSTSAPLAKPNPVRAAVESRISVPGLNFQVSERTLLIVASSRCRYCTNSMPFYRRLSALDSRQRGHFRLILIGSEPADVLRGYIDESNLEVDAVLSVESASNPSSVTPTLILVDRTGTVRSVWRGQQSQSGEESIVRAVS